MLAITANGTTLTAAFEDNSSAAAFAYGEGAAVRIDDLLKPAKGACALTGMEFAGFEYTCGVSYASRVDDAAREAIAEAGRAQAARVAKLIEEL